MSGAGLPACRFYCMRDRHEDGLALPRLISSSGGRSPDLPRAPAHVCGAPHGLAVHLLDHVTRLYARPRPPGPTGSTDSTTTPCVFRGAPSWPASCGVERRPRAIPSFAGALSAAACSLGARAFRVSSPSVTLHVLLLAVAPDRQGDFGARRQRRRSELRSSFASFIVLTVDRRITSPVLRPALSAGPPGVTEFTSTRAPPSARSSRPGRRSSAVCRRPACRGALYLY